MCLRHKHSYFCWKTKINLRHIIRNPFSFFQTLYISLGDTAASFYRNCSSKISFMEVFRCGFQQKSSVPLSMKRSSYIINSFETLFKRQSLLALINIRLEHNNLYNVLKAKFAYQENFIQQVLTRTKGRTLNFVMK